MRRWTTLALVCALAAPGLADPNADVKAVADAFGLRLARRESRGAERRRRPSR